MRLCCCLYGPAEGLAQDLCCGLTGAVCVSYVPCLWAAMCCGAVLGAGGAAKGSTHSTQGRRRVQISAVRAPSKHELLWWSSGDFGTGSSECAEHCAVSGLWWWLWRSAEWDGEGSGCIPVMLELQTLRTNRYRCGEVLFSVNAVLITFSFMLSWHLILCQDHIPNALKTP